MRICALACVALAAACSFSGTPGDSVDSPDGPGDDGVDAAAITTDASVTAVCVPLPSGAIAWWDGEELGVDLLGSFSAFDMFEEPSVERGLVGNAITLEENEDLIFDPAPSASAFTIEGWIRRAKDDVDYMTVYGNGDDAGVFLFNHRLVYFDADVGNGNAAIGATTLAHGVYYHVAVTYNGTDVTLYVNGREDGATSGVAVDLPSLGRIGGVLFNVGDGDGNDFVGQVDELTVYDRQLTPGEIAAIADAGDLGKCKP